MSTEYVWIPKNDALRKEYQSNKWYNVLIANLNKQDTFYCMGSRRELIDTALQTKLVAPLCAVDNDYRNCLVILSDSEQFGFIWQDRRCFSLKSSLIEDLSKPSMSFYRPDDVIKIISEKELISQTEISVRRIIPLLPVLNTLIALIILVTTGFSIWLF